MENIQKINIDIMNNKHSDYIYAKQYDLNRIVDFTITENGKIKNLDNTYCTFLMKGDEVVSFKHLTRNGDTYRLQLETNDTHEAGKIPYQLVLSSGEVTIEQDEHGEWHVVWGDDGVIIGTVTSYMLVEKCVVSEDDAASQFNSSLLQDLLGAVEEAEAAIDEATEVATEAISLTSASATKAESYAVGGTGNRTGEDTDNSKYYSEVSKSYAVGGTEILHDGEPDTRDNAKYYYEQTQNFYNKINFITKVTLPATGQGSWHNENKTETVTVPGVIDNQDQQLIVVRPTYESMEEYAACNVMCIQQLTDALVFHCDTKPANDLEVYVCIEDVEWADKTSVSQIIVNATEPENIMNVNDFWVQPYE